MTVDNAGTIPLSPCSETNEVKFSKLTYTASIDWHPTPDMLVYAATRRGYRAGGYNISATAQSTLGLFFSPETVTDYELGFKGNWTFGNDMSAGFNVAYYHQDYSNIQRSATSAAGSRQVTVNAASAKIDGVEVEGRFSPAPWIEFSGYYSKITPKFQNYVIPNVPALYRDAGANLTPAKFSGISSDQGGATISLRSDLPGDTGRLFANLDFYGQTGFWMQDSNYSAALQTYILSQYIPGYSLLNGSIGWNNVMGKPVDLRLNVRNITNKYYFTGGVDLVDNRLGTSTRFIAEPRMFTVSGTVHF